MEATCVDHQVQHHHRSGTVRASNRVWPTQRKGAALSMSDRPFPILPNIFIFQLVEMEDCNLSNLLLAYPDYFDCLSLHQIY